MYAICVNVQSLLANMTRVALLANILRPILLICTEARTTEDILYSEIQINGYDTLRSDSASRHSGGVVVYKKTGVRCKIVSNIVHAYDHIFVLDVEDSPCRGKWLLVYHSPNSSHPEFIDRLEMAYDDCVTPGQRSHVCGDFNINMHDNNLQPANRLRLQRFFHHNSLKQHVKKYTRVAPQSSTIIDLFASNDNQVKIEVSDDHKIADHKTLIMRKPTTRKSYDRIKITDRNACTYDTFTDILDTMLNASDENLTNFDDRAARIHNAIHDCVNSLTCEKTITLAYAKRWYTDELRRLRRSEEDAHRRAQILRTDEAWILYRRARNIYNKELNRAKNDEIRDIFIQNGRDTKKIWLELKKIFNNHPPQPDFINFDGRILGDDQEIANNFNTYFIDSVTALHDMITPEPFELQPLDIELNTCDGFKPLTPDVIYDVLNKIKKNSGVKNVNKEILRMSLDVCGEDLLSIYNYSLTNGVFPQIWKCTFVTPIPKVQRTNKAEEFRPINQAYITDKVIQSGVKMQLEEHVRLNEILSPVQSAFRGHHSCETSINLILLKWKEAVMRKKKIIAVFLDLKRAFETVDHTILCAVLSHYGVRGKALDWFRSWLHDRRQYTTYKNKTSDSKQIKIGIPQGTPLSCILFILYINEIPRVLINCFINLFADDTLIWVEADDWETATTMLNEDLERVSKFLRMMKLKLNVEKTKCMCLGMTRSERLLQRPQIVIDNEPVIEVNCLKYLGVMIDNGLSFNENLEYLMKKIAKKVGFLARNKKRMDMQTRLLFYRTIISPHFDYCASILLLATESQILELQKLQNKCLRLITSSDRRTNIHGMLNETNLLDVKQRLCYNVLVLVFKAQRKLLPAYLSQHFVFVSDSQPYNLRRNKLLRPPTYRTTNSQNSFVYRGTQMYNDMLALHDINEGTTLEHFKKIAEQFARAHYSSHRIPT